MQKKLLKFYRIALKYGLLTAIKISLNINSKRDIKLYLKDIAHPITLGGIKNYMLAFYEVVVLEGYKLKLNFEPSVIIDGGANIGLTTIFYKQKFPNAKIITVEPDKSNFEALERNLKFYSNVFNINAGLWYKNSFIKIVDKYGFGKSGM